MNELKKMERILEKIFNLSPPLIGKVSKQASRCGNPKCKCKTESGYHGMHHQLSYTLNGKSSTMSVRDEDIDSAKRMNESHKELRMQLKQLAESSAAVCRENGASKAYELMDEIIQKVRYAKSEEFEKFQTAKALEKSRDRWKIRALQNQNDLEKNRIKIKDLTKSREKWRNNTMLARREKEDCLAKLSMAEKKNDVSAKRLDQLGIQVDIEKKKS
jgi:hypothetical protein